MLYAFRKIQIILFIVNICGNSFDASDEQFNIALLLPAFIQNLKLGNHHIFLWSPSTWSCPNVTSIAVGFVFEGSKENILKYDLLVWCLTLKKWYKTINLQAICYCFICDHHWLLSSSSFMHMWSIQWKISQIMFLVWCWNSWKLTKCWTESNVGREGACHTQKAIRASSKFFLWFLMLEFIKKKQSTEILSLWTVLIWMKDSLFPLIFCFLGNHNLTL